MLRDVIVDTVTAPIRNLRSGAALGHVKDFWALRDVSAEINEGEVVGIIGRNGAGKSTLLKILSRITDPTGGRAVLHGRVGSLLEVGTGFHPELTGRENVFLNGSILGMSRQEVKSKFDEIVEFSGVEKFIDTPIKRYSSGMKVRLGFAVAAHLELEILLVDEVLAVGDAEFQRKCLGKMGDVANSGRTILFVSHNMAAMRNLCSRAIMLEHGSVVKEGNTDEVVSHYLQRLGTSTGTRDLDDPTVPRTGNGDAKFTSVELLTLGQQPATALPMGEGLSIELGVESRCSMENVVLAINLFDQQGTRVCAINSETVGNWTLQIGNGERTKVACRILKANLAAGVYSLNLAMRHQDVLLDRIEHAVSLEVVPADVFGTGRSPSGVSIMYLEADWEKTVAAK